MKRWPWILLAGLLAWLVGYPLLITLAEAFGASTSWTLRHVSDFVQRADEWLALWRTLWISLASVVLAAAVGVPLAFLFERTEFPGRKVLAVLVALPVALPPLVGVIAFLFLYGESGLVTRALGELLGLDRAPWRLTGPGAILLVHTYSMYVYFYLFVRAALARLDGSLLEAAAALGAGPFTTFRRVTLPLLKPALTGAALLTFMTSLASFSAPYLFGGGFRVMTTQIVASKLNGEIEAAHVETLALALVAFGALVAIRRYEAGQRLTGTVRGVAPRPKPLESKLARTLAGAAGYLLVVVLLLPHLTLLLMSLVPPATWTTELWPPELSWGNYATLFGEPRRLTPILHSLWMAVVATLGATVLGFAAARGAKRQAERPLGRALEILLAIPWAVPGTVFAIALATTFSQHAPWFGRFVLVGTPFILPLAYLVRSLPLTGRASLAGLAQLDPAQEEASASLGASSWRTFRRVVLPVVRPALVAGASLAFLTGFGDFVTSVVLYTPDVMPISIAIDTGLRASFGEPAAYGVLLMIVSTTAFLIWGRRQEHT